MKQVNRIRNRNFSMRLNEEEDALLDARSDEFNMSRAEYLRTVILFASVNEHSIFHHNFAKKLCSRLNTIGNQINQIAYEVNSRRGVIEWDVQRLKTEYENLWMLYGTIIESWN